MTVAHRPRDASGGPAALAPGHAMHRTCWTLRRPACCARCDFYSPKDSTRAQLLEAKGNLQKVAVSIPLTGDEQAALTDGQTVIDELLGGLADTPTPAGPPPRQIRTPNSSAPADRRRPTGQINASLTHLLHRKVVRLAGPVACAAFTAAGGVRRG